MEWLNLHTATLDSPELRGAEPVQRATWLMLMRFCIGQENGGRIPHAKTWTDRNWQQLVGVTAREVRRSSALWSWEENELLVWAYPADAERKVQKNRKNGALGGRPPLTQREPCGSASVNHEVTNRIDFAETKGKDKDKDKDKEIEREGAQGEDVSACARAPDPEADPTQPSPPRSDPPASVNSDVEWRMRVGALPWAQALRRAGAKIGPQNWPAWEALVTAHTLERVTAACGALAATARWPDAVEDHLRKSRDQTPLGEAVRRKTRHLTLT